MMFSSPLLPFGAPMIENSRTSLMKDCDILKDRSFWSEPTTGAIVEHNWQHRSTTNKFTAKDSDKHSYLSFFKHLFQPPWFFCGIFLGNILVARVHIKAGFLLVYTTEIHTTDNEIFNPLKLTHCSEGASDCLLYCLIHVPPKEGLQMNERA